MDLEEGLNKFPDQQWVTVRNWLRRASGPQNLYFLAMVARDVGLCKAELELLNDREKIHLWTKPFPFRQQTFELYRRFGRPSYTQGDIIFMKRESVRLGVHIRPLEFLYNRVVEDDVQRYDFNSAREDYLEALMKKETRYKTVNNDIRFEDLLCPTDAQYLDETSWKFPRVEWAAVSKWATKVPFQARRVEILNFMKKVACLDLFPTLETDKSNMKRLKEYNWRVHARSFVKLKQSAEYVRRLRFNSLSLGTVRMLMRECARRDIFVPFLTYIDVHLYDHASDTNVSLQHWMEQFAAEELINTSVLQMNEAVAAIEKMLLEEAMEAGETVPKEVEQSHLDWYFCMERKYKAKTFGEMMNDWETEEEEFKRFDRWEYPPHRI